MELAGALTNLALILRERRKRYIEHHKDDTSGKQHEEHAKELEKEICQPSFEHSPLSKIALDQTI